MPTSVEIADIADTGDAAGKVDTLVEDVELGGLLLGKLGWVILACQ